MHYVQGVGGRKGPPGQPGEDGMMGPPGDDVRIPVHLCNLIHSSNDSNIQSS